MGVPTKPPTFRTLTLPRVAPTREHVYEMANGRRFYDPTTSGGPYVGATGAARLLEDGSLRLDEDDGARLCE